MTVGHSIRENLFLKNGIASRSPSNMHAPEIKKNNIGPQAIPK